MLKNDQMELELLRIRVKNLEKQNKELKKAPQVKAEKLRKMLDLGFITFSDARLCLGLDVIEDDSQEERRQTLYREGIL